MIETSVLTDQARIPHDGSLGKETVPTLFPFPETCIENLMERPQPEATTINIVHNKIELETNKVKTEFLTMMSWLRAKTAQASRIKKYAGAAVKSPPILQMPSRIKRKRWKLEFQVPGINSPMPTQSIIQHTSNALSAAELQQIATVVIQYQSIASATAMVAPTVAPFTFDGSKIFGMLG